MTLWMLLLLSYKIFALDIQLRDLEDTDGAEDDDAPPSPAQGLSIPEKNYYGEPMGYGMAIARNAEADAVIILKLLSFCKLKKT